MKISRLEINNFIGISEFKMDLGKVNIMTGRVGSGKTSIIEAIRKGFTNQNERVEVVRHGEKEATIFIKTDDGLEIDRRLRTNKADYLKVQKNGAVVPSTEKFLKHFIDGELFKPLEFCAKTPVEQAKTILNMLEIPWNMDNISNWFGEIPNDINYDEHILQILGQIVKNYFTQREVINREIAVLKAQITGYKDELPKNYDGEEWRLKKVAEFYAAVSVAELTNKQRDNATTMIAGQEGRIETVRAEAETEKQIKRNEMGQKRTEIKECKLSLVQKIEQAKTTIDGIGEKRITSQQALRDRAELDTQALTIEYQKKSQEAKELYEAALAQVNRNTVYAQDQVKKTLDSEVAEAQDDIAKCTISRASKEQEYANLDQLEEQSLLSIFDKTTERIKTEDAKVEDSRKILAETALVDVEPLKLAADQVAHMQSFLREYDLMATMIREKLAPREELSKLLTARIEKGRGMPTELLKIAALPIPGISVDSEGLIRIGKTLIDGLSEGEQFELAFRIAKAQAGELKLICLDGWGKINPSDREWIKKEANEDDYQYIISNTEDGDFTMSVAERIDQEDANAQPNE